jgi:hypothetical protein
MTNFPKKAIEEEEKHAFKGVDANVLKIYQVSFPVDHAKLKSFRPEDERDRLPSNSMRRLKVDEHLHVIIERPDTGER